MAWEVCASSRFAGIGSGLDRVSKIQNNSFFRGLGALGLGLRGLGFWFPRFKTTVSGRLHVVANRVIREFWFHKSAASPHQHLLIPLKVHPLQPCNSQQIPR